jgi:penicillin-binding protein 2
VQVARGAEWTARIRGSSEVNGANPLDSSVKSRPQRHFALVQNRASYEVDFYLPEMVKGYRQRYGQPPSPSIAEISAACRRI